MPDGFEIVRLVDRRQSQGATAAGMGHLVVSRAVDLAISKARECGVGWVSTRYSNHAGPASLYARKPLEHQMLGLYFAVGNANHLPPWGGMEMLLSTNPIAAAFPAGNEPPVVLDMATTVAAYGKVKVKAKRGEMMPEGWMIDRQGKPLTDPKRADEGFLLPIGEHKGYGLALMVGLLAGTLNGAAMGKDVIDFNADFKTITNTGQSILVIDLSAFGDPEDFKSRVDTLSRDIRASAQALFSFLTYGVGMWLGNTPVPRRNRPSPRKAGKATDRTWSSPGPRTDCTRQHRGRAARRSSRSTRSRSRTR